MADDGASIVSHQQEAALADPAVKALPPTIIDLAEGGGNLPQRTCRKNGLGEMR